MHQTLKLRQSKQNGKYTPSGIKPLQINWGNGGFQPKITFSDGQSSPGSCLRCIEPPCITYSAKELELEVFQDFPADRNNSVCPTSSITWSDGSDHPIINSNLCIYCGLCIARCPVGAIHLTSNGAVINDKPNDHFLISDEIINPGFLEATLLLFKNIPEKGVYLTESDEWLQRFWNKFEELSVSQNYQFPNHLIRNLLIAVGIGASMRRLGDTNIRMDLALGPPGVERGTGEVEFGGEILDAPRNILDNVAILVARYEFRKDSIVPLVICSSLPNQRSEYWRVVRDIRNVLFMKSEDIYLVTLLILIWNRKLIKIEDGDELYIDIDSPTLRPILETMLSRKLNISDGYPGLVESLK